MGQELDSIRVYSNDHNVWVGMKTKDANTSQKSMELFNFADQDGNGEISKAELDRYNGPLLVENFPQKTARIIGNVGVCPMSGLIITDQEVDYYPGLQIEHVDKAGRVVYNKIDLNHDNVLSAEEMEKVTDAKQKIDEAKEKLDEIQNTRAFLRAEGVCAASLSLIALALGANPFLAVGAAVVFAGLTLANRIVAKNKAQKVLNEVQDVNHPYMNEKKENLKNIV